MKDGRLTFAMKSDEPIVITSPPGYSREEFDEWLNNLTAYLLVEVDEPIPTYDKLYTFAILILTIINTWIT